MVPETVASGSPDSTHIRAEGSASVNINRITLPSTRDLILGTILALSLVGVIAVWQYAKDAYTMAWLAQDQINKFMTNQEPTLETQLRVDEALIQAYGIRNSIHEEISHVGRNHHQSLQGPTHRGERSQHVHKPAPAVQGSGGRHSG